MRHAYSLLVAAAVLVGLELAYRRARRTGLDTRTLINGCMWAVVVGFPVSHWVLVLLYHPDRVLDDPFTHLFLRTGLSSFGGFFGGMLGAFLYFRYKRVEFLPYIEAILFGFVPAWILGRLGCTMAFDHPGVATDFFMGMTDRFGIVRHNLGLYEMLWTVLVAAALYSSQNVRWFRGFHSALVIFLYAPVRFGLDFLRVGEKTYWGLTPAQYGCVGLMCVGLYLVTRGLRAPAPDPRPDRGGSHISKSPIDRGRQESVLRSNGPGSVD